MAATASTENWSIPRLGHRGRRRPLSRVHALSVYSERTGTASAAPVQDRGWRKPGFQGLRPEGNARRPGPRPDYSSEPSGFSPR